MMTGGATATGARRDIEAHRVNLVTGWHQVAPEKFVGISVGISRILKT
jgi:hypothetical protein